MKTIQFTRDGERFIFRYSPRDEPDLHRQIAMSLAAHDVYLDPDEVTALVWLTMQAVDEPEPEPVPRGVDWASVVCKVTVYALAARGLLAVLKGLSG